MNLIADAPVVKELIQNDLNIKNMHHEMDLLLGDSPEHDKLMKNYGMIHEKLGGEGASARVATKIIEDLSTFGVVVVSTFHPLLFLPVTTYENVFTDLTLVPLPTGLAAVFPDVDRATGGALFLGIKNWERVFILH